MRSKTRALDRRPLFPPRVTPSRTLAVCLLGCFWPGCDTNRGSKTNDTATSDHPAPGVLDAPASPSAAASSSTPIEKPPADAPHTEPARVYAKTRNVWIQGAPTSDVDWIGFLWFGSSVAVRDAKPVPGAGCSREWYPIEPQGWVCVDGERATLDIDDPLLKGVAPYAPNLDSPWPHPYYGESTGVPRYRTLPSLAEQQERELSYLKRLATNPAAAISSATPTATKVSLPELPRVFIADQTWLIPRSAMAWSAEVEHLGRNWLLAADLAWVPKDRLTPYPKVTFKGVHLGKDAQLPLAFFRGKDRPKYVKAPTGELQPNNEVFPRLSWVELSGSQIEQSGVIYLQTKDPNVYVARDDAVLPELRKETPWGAATLQEDTTGHAPKGRQTWIESSVMGGWLVAYEGTTPVFTTLTAPGRGGPPVADRDPVETASTPTGFFRITGKVATATMVADNDLVHADVPWAQNFSGPHALHSAYWHDRWGELKSGGCINVSPIDGKWLYEFTEPAVPIGWHAVRWQPDKGPATGLIVNRR